MLLKFQQFIQILSVSSQIDHKRYTIVCLDVEIENFREDRILNDSIESSSFLNVFIWICSAECDSAED